jgi:hypothetical protein
MGMIGGSLVRRYDQELWMRAEAAYLGDGLEHPPYEAGVETPYKKILRAFSTSTASQTGTVS